MVEYDEKEATNEGGGWELFVVMLIVAVIGAIVIANPGQ